MYYFDQPLSKIVKAARALAKEFAASKPLSSQTRSINYPIFVGNVARPIGNLKITAGVTSNYGDGWISATVKLNDLDGEWSDQAATIETADIAAAIAFTCGVAKANFAHRWYN